jgi:uncharacterized protein
MLSLDVRALAKQAASVAGELAPSDPVWGGADVLPVSSVKVTGRVSAAGGGRYYWSGHIEGDAVQQCTRCLDPVEVHVKEDVRAIFAEDDTGDDDPDVYIVDAASGTLDLKPAVREHWLLSVPRFVLCSDDCKGLCPTCGENLNHVVCSHVPAGDPRWDALRQTRQE